MSFFPFVLLSFVLLSFCADGSGRDWASVQEMTSVVASPSSSKRSKLKNRFAAPEHQSADAEEGGVEVEEVVLDSDKAQEDAGDSVVVALPGVNLLFNGSVLLPFDVSRYMQGRLPAALIAQTNSASRLTTRSSC